MCERGIRRLYWRLTEQLKLNNARSVFAGCREQVSTLRYWKHCNAAAIVRWITRPMSRGLPSVGITPMVMFHAENDYNICWSPAAG